MGHCPPVCFATTSMRCPRLRRGVLRASPLMNTFTRPSEGAGGSRSKAKAKAKARANRRKGSVCGDALRRGLAPAGRSALGRSSRESSRCDLPDTMWCPVFRAATRPSGGRPPRHRICARRLLLCVSVGTVWDAGTGFYIGQALAYSSPVAAKSVTDLSRSKSKRGRQSATLRMSALFAAGHFCAMAAVRGTPSGVPGFVSIYPGRLTRVQLPPNLLSRERW